MWQETMHCTILYNILYKIKDFLIAKVEAILFLAKPINKEKSPYINAVNKRDPAGINEEMSKSSKAAKY